MSHNAFRVEFKGKMLILSKETVLGMLRDGVEIDLLEMLSLEDIQYSDVLWYELEKGFRKDLF
jgi:hypothetical protein